MSLPVVGQTAPDFSLSSDSGAVFTLSDHRGKNVVLYFYPKDDTSGCTVQACAVRDDLPEFVAAGAVVVGISPDSVTSHEKFRDKYDLNFPLLSDPDKAVCQAYGVWQEKSMYGRKYMGVQRTTFIVGSDGVLTHVFEKVKPAAHAGQVKAALQETR